MKFLAMVLGFSTIPAFADAYLICDPGHVTAPTIQASEPIHVTAPTILVSGPPAPCCKATDNDEGSNLAAVTITCHYADPRSADAREGTLLRESTILSVATSCKPIFGPDRISLQTRRGPNWRIDRIADVGTHGGPAYMLCSEPGGGLITNWILPVSTSVAPSIGRSNMGVTSH